MSDAAVMGAELQTSPLSSEPRLVSVVMPVRDEARHIASCLQSLVDQDYPMERVEVLVSDGMSTDGTRQIVEEFQRRFPYIRLIDNPAGIVPTALNMGVAASRGSVVLRVDGHTVLPPTYLRRCVALLEEVAADVVGGRIIHHGNSYIGEAIAIAMGSRFGTGNSKYRHGNQAGETDTVQNAAYRRELFDRVGTFDERLIRNQDIEFHARVRSRGGYIHFDPTLQTLYHVRPTVSGFLRQAFANGRWNIITARLRPGSLSVRHFVPMAFVVGMAGGAVLGTAGLGWRWLGVVLGPYAVLAALVSVGQAVRRGLWFLPILPALFFLLHAAYGLGSLRGILDVARPTGNLLVDRSAERS